MHEDRYQSELHQQSLEQRIVVRYAGVDALHVARIERIAPFEVRAIRARHRRSVDDGQQTPPGWKEQLGFDDLARMMSTNRSPHL